jgi:hypothetical protein
MNENERRNRINQRLAEVGLSIESSGLRGTTDAWEKLLIGFTEDDIRTAYAKTHKGSKHVEVFITALKEIRDGGIDNG